MEELEEEEEEEEEEEGENEKKKYYLICKTLKRLSLLDSRLVFKKRFIHRILSVFPSLEYFEIDGEYNGSIKLKSNPQFDDLRQRFPQLAFLVQNTLEVDDNDDNDNDNGSDDDNSDDDDDYSSSSDYEYIDENDEIKEGVYKSPNVSVRIQYNQQQPEQQQPEEPQPPHPQDEQIVFGGHHDEYQNQQQQQPEEEQQQQEQPQPPKRKKKRKRKRLYKKHKNLNSLVIHPPKGTMKTPTEERNIQDLLTEIVKRCPKLDYLELPIVLGMRILMAPSELREKLMEKRTSFLKNQNNEEQKDSSKKDIIQTPVPPETSSSSSIMEMNIHPPEKKYIKKKKEEEEVMLMNENQILSTSRNVRLMYDLEFYREDDGFTTSDQRTHRKVFFLNGFLWMFGLMIKMAKNPDGDLMSGGLLSFDSVYAIRASNEIRIDDTLRTDRKRWFSPQARQMYTVHLTDRRNRRFIEVDLKIQVEQMMKSLQYRDICFSAAKRAEQKKDEIQGREDSALIRIQKNENHREGPLWLFGLEWSYKFYRTKGSVDRASFYILRNFGGRIVIPMSYRLSLPNVDCDPKFEIQACETNYQLHKGWGYTDVIIPDSPGTDMDEFKLEMRIGEHVMTHEEYTLNVKQMLSGIKVGDIETKTVIIPVDNFYASTQYPAPVKICGFPLCLEFYPLGYYGNTQSIAIGLCHHIEVYKLKARYTVEVGGVKQEKEDDQIETIFNELCPIDKNKREWEFTISIEVLELKETPIDLPF